MMQFNFAQRTFKVSFFLMGSYLFVVSLLISLGYWQLHRAEEKTLFLQHRQQQSNQSTALTLAAEESYSALRYRTVVVEGHYEVNTQFLIDNQIVNAKAGYFVMTPFVLTGTTKAVLINRGWIATTNDRQRLPNIQLTADQTHVRGRINHFPSVGLMLKGAEIPTPQWPSVVQVVHHDILAEKLGYELYPFQIELHPEQPHGYYRQWREQHIMLPEKHIAYAVQWFGLAITLTFLFFWNSLKKHPHDRSTKKKIDDPF